MKFSENFKLKWTGNYLEHGSADTAVKVGPSEVVDFLGQIVAAAHCLDDFVQTGHDGVGLAQEVAVGHQLRLGHVSEKGEFLLVFGVSLDETLKR